MRMALDARLGEMSVDLIGKAVFGVLPDIAAEEVFALKGGTAINLFYRDMPRISPRTL